MIIEKYGAEWCGPCRALDKTLDEFERKYPEIEVRRFDVDELSEGILNDLAIKSVPVIRIMEDTSTERKRFVGAQPLTVLENELS